MSAINKVEEIKASVKESKVIKKVSIGLAVAGGIAVVGAAIYATSKGLKAADLVNAATEAAPEVATSDHLLDEQTRHDGLSRAGVVRKNEAKRHLGEHVLIDG